MYVTPDQLIEHSRRPEAVWVGSSGNAEASARDYFREGYRGTMFACPTPNMRKAVQIIRYHWLRNREPIPNYADEAEEADGYYYVIVGERPQ